MKKSIIRKSFLQFRNYSSIVKLKYDIYQKPDFIKYLKENPANIYFATNSIKFLQDYKNEINNMFKINEYRPYSGKQFNSLYPHAKWYMEFNSNGPIIFENKFKNSLPLLKISKNTCNSGNKICEIELPNDAIILATANMMEQVYTNIYNLKKVL